MEPEESAGCIERVCGGREASCSGTSTSTQLAAHSSGPKQQHAGFFPKSSSASSQQSISGSERKPLIQTDPLTFRVTVLKGTWRPEHHAEHFFGN